jgi:SAM-dependent methyltransferase
MRRRSATHLEPDGERMVVEYYQSSPEEYLIYLFHEASYRFAQNLVKGSVLDLGCGSGYGTAMLSRTAQRVVGADVSLKALEHARKEFGRNGVEFFQLSEDLGLPFADREFDAVVCFQVIEHVRDHERFAAEIARVLKPHGLAILATPDRSTRLFSWQKPWNRWHLREYSAETLSGVLSPFFNSVEMRFMSGTPEVIDLELARCRRTKWATIPFTLPVIPEWARFLGLSMLRAIRRKPASTSPSVEASYSFGVEDISINSLPMNSVNLVAVARNPRG